MRTNYASNSQTKDAGLVELLERAKLIQASNIRRLLLTEKDKRKFK